MRVFPFGESELTFGLFDADGFDGFFEQPMAVEIASRDAANTVSVLLRERPEPGRMRGWGGRGAAEGFIEGSPVCC